MLVILLTDFQQVWPPIYLCPAALRQLSEVGAGREEVVDLVVLEQFITRLPKRTVEWV